ncbi:hypothetical protein A2311_03575 [candidate division WOR-1 bacterium RIFOXYB2_FULL_48_7]|uniref:Uncharacterized protein n=1 Tax=candidate division WOR-1 bacterium RIFOXYB2_FULL_48_7 TaxID=1802583 RepID=A0A1F4TSL1_UNCSA|nr:MAG: hypothetical protein A2311_03575 [candidate division WOR-1 bacterium RIFOXYB2_FULL_48_7]
MNMSNRFNSISEIEAHFKTIANALPDQCKAGDPWVFLSASALIEYLAKLVVGEDNKRTGFIDFIKKWMPSGYYNFVYKNSKRDLPEQMYYVLRCGIVHAFSLIPDDQGKSYGGRERSIVLAHRREQAGQHLKGYEGNNGTLDSVIFVAEDFIADVLTTMMSIFDSAKSDEGLKNNITIWVQKHPPIIGGF